MRTVIIEKVRNLAYYKIQIKGMTCRLCVRDRDTEQLIDQEEIIHYDHDGGWEVDGFKSKQWLYVECPKCGHQWSFAKLGIPQH